MRRNGAEGIGINQQPVQHFTALRQPHPKTHCMSPSPASPAQPSPTYLFRAARLFVEPEVLLCAAGRSVYGVPTTQPVGEVK